MERAYWEIISEPDPNDQDVQFVEELRRERFLPPTDEEVEVTLKERRNAESQLVK
jgi:hypothetical protein